MTRLVEAVGLSVGYNNHAVVHDLDLHVAPGEVVAVLGPNGAGKTTTLLTLAGELRPVGGEVRFRGARARVPLHRLARRGLALVTEERSVFPTLTARENLRLGRGDMDLALELFPELERLLGRRGGLLSGGEQQMLTLARALSRKPDLLLADELSLGLAPLIVHQLLDTVRRAADEGVGVLLVEQHVKQALRIADRVYVMRRGRIVLRGSALEIGGRLEEAYLAVGGDEGSAPASPPDSPSLHSPPG